MASLEEIRARIDTELGRDSPPPTLEGLKDRIRRQKFVPIPEVQGLPERPEPRAFGSIERGLARLGQATAVGLSEAGLVPPERAARAIGEAQLDIADAPPPPEVEQGLREISEAGSFGEALSAIVRNPSAVASVVGESLPLSVPALGLAAGGSLAGPGGTAAGVGTGSALVEYSASLLESLQGRGIDPLDSQAVAAALQDQEFLADARARAATRGVAIGTFDAITGGLAGRLLAGARGVGSAALRGTGELGIQAAGGAGGEAAAQLATEGEITSPGEVLLEAAAEVLPGVGEVALNLPGQRGTPTPPAGRTATTRRTEPRGPTVGRAVPGDARPQPTLRRPQSRTVGDRSSDFAPSSQAAPQPGDIARDFVRRQIRTGTGRQAPGRLAERGPEFPGRRVPGQETTVSESETGTAGPTDATPGRPRRRPVRQAPLTLAEFLAEEGGVQDQTGELRAVDADKFHRERPFQKRLVRDEGLTPDAARERAEEAGFIPSGSDLATFYDAIDRDLRGERIVAPGDIGAELGAETARATAENRARMEAAASDLGIPQEAVARLSDDELAAALDREAAIDQTEQGPQTVIPGAGQITARERVERGLEGRIQPTVPQQAADEGLFDVAGRGQVDIDDVLAGQPQAEGVDLPDVVFSEEPGGPTRSGNFSGRSADIRREASTRGFQAGERHKGFVRDVFDPDKEPLPEKVRPLTRQDIIAPLMKDLGVPLFEGRIKSKKVRGFFRPSIEEVRVKRTADIEVTAHEIAHLLDKRFPEIRQQWKRNKAIAEEMRAVSYDKTKLFEGFAEFVRLWSTQAQEAQARAPLMFEWFENFLEGNRHGPALRTAQEQMHAFFAQAALDRARSKIGAVRNVNEVTDASRGKRWRAGALDDLFGILNAEQTLTGRYNGPWYVQARLTRGVSDIVGRAMEIGAPVWGSPDSDGLRQIDIVDAEGLPFFVQNARGQVVPGAGNPKNGAKPWGLANILKPIAHDLEMSGIYFIGKRAEFLKAQGRENLFTEAEIKAMVALETPLRKKAFEDWNKFNKQMLDFAQAAGVVNAEARSKFETDVYLPFYRVTEPQAGRPGSTEEGIPGFTGVIKRLRGGTGNVGDPIENMYKNTRMLVESAVFNNAKRTAVRGILKEQGQSPEQPGGARFLAPIPTTSKLVQVRMQSIQEAMTERFDRQLEAEGRERARKGEEGEITIAEDLNARREYFDKTLDDVFDKLPLGALQVWQDNQPPGGKRIIAIMQNGKPKFFEVADELLFDAYTTMPRALKNGGILRFFKFWRRLGQRTVTWSLDFAIRNFARDQLMATALSEDGFRPFIDAARGIKSRMFQDATYQAYLANGGGMASFWSSERAFENQLRTFYERHGIAYNLVVNTPKKFGFFLDRILDSFETATRLGEFKRSLGRGRSIPQSTFQGREVSTDFAMRGDPRVDILVHGDAATLSALYDIVIFLKAGVVGVDRLYRGLARQNNKNWAAGITGTISLATVFLYMINRGNPLYDRLEDWDRDANWHLFIPKIEFLEQLFETGRLPDDVPPEDLYWHFRYPKPWEIGGVATITERAIEGIIDKDPSQGPAILNVVREMFRYNIIPQFIQPIAEQAANRQFFFDRPIEPPSIQGLEPFARSMPQTSRTITELGLATRDLPRSLQIPPARTEALLRGYFNTWAMYGLMLSDQMFFDATPELRLDQYPGLRTVFRQQPPRSTRFQTMFYDMLKEASETRRTILTMDRRMRPGIAEELEIKPQNREFDQLDNARKIVQGLNAEMRLIINMPDLLSMQEHAGQLARERELRPAIDRIRRSSSWRDLGLLKRDLLNMWLAQRHIVFETVVKDIEEQRSETEGR